MASSKNHPRYLITSSEQNWRSHEKHSDEIGTPTLQINSARRMCALLQRQQAWHHNTQQNLLFDSVEWQSTHSEQLRESSPNRPSILPANEGQNSTTQQKCIRSKSKKDHKWICLPYTSSHRIRRSVCMYICVLLVVLVFPTMPTTASPCSKQQWRFWENWGTRRGEGKTNGPDKQEAFEGKQSHQH